MATREMIDVMKKLKDLGYYDQVDEGKKAKPDYIDIDGDGNKKEPMKKAVKDKEKKKTNEAKACNCNEDCACGGNCGPNCNCGPDCGKSVKESVNEAITITADSPDDLPALQRIMKLAGMEPVGQDMMPQGDTPDMTMKGDDNINGNCGCEDEAEGYANEPDAQYSTTNDITRLAGLNGLNGSKNPKDLRVKDPAYHEDEQTEEGYANSMGKEKEEETYSVDSLEKQYGKTEIKKLPRKFSMRGDNPLEDIEEALRQDYITFVNESADVKKKTNHSQINEAIWFAPAVAWIASVGRLAWALLWPAIRVGTFFSGAVSTWVFYKQWGQFYKDIWRDAILGNMSASQYWQIGIWTAMNAAMIFFGKPFKLLGKDKGFFTNWKPKPGQPKPPKNLSKGIDEFKKEVDKLNHQTQEQAQKIVRSAEKHDPKTFERITDFQKKGWGTYSKKDGSNIITRDDINESTDIFSKQEYMAISKELDLPNIKPSGKDWDKIMTQKSNKINYQYDFSSMSEEEVLKWMAGPEGKKALAKLTGAPQSNDYDNMNVSP